MTTPFLEGWMPIPAVCGLCGNYMDSYTAIGPGTAPEVGDVTVCIYCGSVYRFGWGLKPHLLQWAEVARLSFERLFQIARLEIVIQDLRARERLPEYTHNYAGTEAAGNERTWGPGLFCIWALMEEAIPRHVSFSVWVENQKFRVINAPTASSIKGSFIATRAYGHWQSKMSPEPLTKETAAEEARILLEVLRAGPVCGIIDQKGRDA